MDDEPYGAIQRADAQPDSIRGLGSARSQGPGMVEQALGLGQQGLQAVGSGLDAITSSRRLVQSIFEGLQAAGAAQTGATPLFLQQQHLDLQRQQIQEQASERRQHVAQQIQAQEETKRQNQWEDVGKILGNDKLSPPQQMTMLKEMGKQNPQASIAAQQVNEKMIAQFRLHKDKLPFTPEQYGQKLAAGEITWHDVAAHIGQAEEETKQTAKEDAQRTSVQRLLDQFAKDPHSLNDTQLAIIDTHVTSNQERGLKIQKLQQELIKGRQEIVRGSAPIVSPGFPNMEGQTQHIITDPRTGKQQTTAGIALQRTQTEETPKVTLVDAAKIAALNTGVKDIGSLEKTIIGSDQTINRQTLFTGKIFGGLPFTHGKDIDRWILDMVQTKFRLETGAAARPDEEATMMRRFAPKITDPDSTIVEKLSDLKQWHLNTLNVFDPTGILRGRLGPSSVMGAPPQSREEVYGKIKKQHPDWTKDQVYTEMHKRGIQ